MQILREFVFKHHYFAVKAKKELERPFTMFLYDFTTFDYCKGPVKNIYMRMYTLKSNPRAVPHKRSYPPNSIWLGKYFRNNFLDWRFEPFEEHLFYGFLIFMTKYETCYFEID